MAQSHSRRDLYAECLAGALEGNWDRAMCDHSGVVIADEANS